MASLNTLRTRGGIIVSIVIGIALLAFIVSDQTFLDIFRGGQNARDPKVGIIDGESVRYNEYITERKRDEDISKMMTGRSMSDQGETLNNMAWEAMLMKYSYMPGFEKLGLAVTEAEQVDMTSGAYLSPVITSTFVNPQTGMYDPAMLRDFVSNINVNPGTYEVWEYLKEQMNNQRTLSKYMTLITKGMYINDLDVDASLKLSQNTYDISYVTKEYASIADSLVTVTGKEIREYYDAHKQMFKQTASRDIDYVVFEITPSEADYAEGEKRVNELAEEFKTASNPAQFALLNSQGDRTPARFVTEDKVESAIAEVILKNPEAMYGPVLDGDTYTMARLAETKMMPDTVGVSHILLMPGQDKLADSLMTVLRGGADFAAVAREYSQDTNTGSRGGDMGRLAPDMLEAQLPEFTAAVLTEPLNTLFKVTATYGIHIGKVTYRTVPVKKYKVATLKYTVRASSATQNSKLAEAQTFYTQANGSYDDFKKAVTESALSKRIAHLNFYDRKISGIENSGEVVRWAFNNKLNTVSEPIAAGLDYFIVAAVTGIKEQGYATVEESAQNIRTKLRQQKKADMLIAEMKGSTLSEVATATGKEVDTTTKIGFSSFYVDKVGVELNLIGAVCATPETGKMSKPVKGSSGVYLFSVDTITPAENVNAVDQRVKLEAADQSYVQERTTQAMYDASKVTDNRVKYF